jgi:hypothetical protein
MCSHCSLVNFQEWNCWGFVKKNPATKFSKVFPFYILRGNDIEAETSEMRRNRPCNKWGRVSRLVEVPELQPE